MLRKCINYFKTIETEKQALLRHVFENNTEEIETLINNNLDLLYETYENNVLDSRWDQSNNLPILHTACLNKNKNIKACTIETLIKCGANADYKTGIGGYAPLHCAVIGGNVENLQLLVHYINNINITTNHGLTSLMLLVYRIYYGEHELGKPEECINILLKKEIDVNIQDENFKSAIHHASYWEQHNIVKFLLAECKDIDIDIYSSEERLLLSDPWDIGFNTARALITKLGISTIHIPNKYFDSLDYIGKLKHYLNAGDEEGFIQLASSISSIDDKYEPKTLIQLACQYNLLSVVKYLIKRDVNINSVSERCHYRPIELAINHGSVDIVIFLLDQVPTVNKNISFNKITTFFTFRYNSGYWKCIEILFERCSHYLDVNEHFDLDFGNNILSSCYHDVPLSYFGDKSNIARLLLKNGASLANKDRNSKLAISEVNYEILMEHFNNCIEEKILKGEICEFSYNYKTLFPSYSDETKFNKSFTSLQPKPELEVVFYISKSNQLRNLLKHPLITSFLYLKWYQIQWIFYINLLFYFLYYIILLMHIVTSNNKEFGLTSVFLILATTILLLKELFQIWILPRNYFTNFENYVEIALVATVLFVLFSEYNIEKNKQIYAVIILFAALELLFILGNLPSLSTYILMLRVVSLNFFKFLLFYSILLFAFAFSFHMLLNDDNYVTIFESQPEDTKTINFFGNYALSIFKTIVMLSGELDASNILFDKYPITSHLMFLVFVITIPIILLNLLNGLAISDTHHIRNEAELFVLIARVEYLKYVESMIFGNIRIFSCYPLRLVQRALFRKCLVLGNLLESDLSFKIQESKSNKWVIKRKRLCRTSKVHFDKNIKKESERLLKEKKEERNMSSTNVQSEDNFKEIRNCLDKQEKRLMEIGNCLDNQDRRLVDTGNYLDEQNKKIMEIGSRLDAQDKRLLEIQEQVVNKLEILEKFIIEVASGIQDKAP